MTTKLLNQVAEFEAGARGISAGSLNAMLAEIKRLANTIQQRASVSGGLFQFKNTGTASVAFGCPMIADTSTYTTGVTAAGQNGYLTLKKPDADGFIPVYLNMGGTVAQNEYGVCMLCSTTPFLARVAEAVTAIAGPSNGRVGTQSGTATFAKSISGFLVLAYHGDYYGDGNLWATLTLDIEMPMVGAISEFWVATAPTGYLLTDGAAFSETQYPRLYRALGDVATLPDIRGRATICQGTGAGLTARVVKATVGTETHALTGSEVGDHSHSANHERSPDSYMAGTDTWALVEPWSTAGNSTGPNTPPGGTAHQNMQPSIVVAKAIKY